MTAAATVATAAIIASFPKLPLDQVEANDVALRAVDLEDPGVQKMFDSIAKDGVLMPIRVRPSMLADKKTPKTLPDGRAVYQVIDGLHRFTGAVKGKLETIPVLVVSADDADVEKQQMKANLHRIPTKPYEYGKHLKRIIARDQTQTRKELANELNVSEEFLDGRLGLNGLHQDGKDENGEPTSSIGKLVDEGRITISNAMELARLKPSEEQLNFVTDAIEMKPIQFAQKVKLRIKELREAKQQARDPNEVTAFVPSCHFRDKGSVEAEFKSPHVLPLLIKSKGISDPIEAAKFALEWVLSLDEQSITAAKAKWDAREKERAADAAKRKAERAKKAHEEAQAAAAKVSA